MQRVKSSNVTSIDALAKNLINRNNKSLNCSSSSSAEAMTKTATNTNTATSAAITAIAKASENLLNRKKSLCNNSKM